MVITPSTATVAVGANVTLTAEVLDAAGKTLTGIKVVWASADPSIATVSSSGVVTGVATGVVHIAASAVGKNAIAEVTVNPTPVASVRLTPPNQNLLVGQTVQLGAETLDADGNVLTGRPVEFTSSNAAVATVSNTGLVTALVPGSAIITAASEGKSAPSSITVSSVPVASVAVTPTGSQIVVGQTTQLNAEPRDASGQPLVGRAVSWSSSDPNVASVSSTGLVTAVAPGQATITATSEAAAGTSTIGVSPKPVSSVIISPGQGSVTVGQTLQLSAQVTDDQGNVLTGRPIAFTSGTPAVATISATGLVTGVAPGSTTITATSEGKTGTATVTVTPIPVAKVEITPSTPNVTVGETVQLNVSVQGPNNQELTGRTVTWSSGAPSVASVSPTGVVSGLAPGTAIIFANVEGVLGSATVTVKQVPVGSVVVSPQTASVPVGGAVQLSASVRDASGAELQGRLVGWTSSDETIAVVSSEGRVSGIKIGTATITASSEGKSGTATVTVTAAAVASVNVTPPTASITVGQTTTLTAQPLDANGNALTGRAVAWASSNAGVATVSDAGVVTGVAPGDATITATSEGKSGTATVTVTPIPVASVTVDPATVSLTTGATQQITATPRDAQGNPLADRAVTWESQNPAVATVSPAGLITAVAPGNTTVTATSEGKVGTVTVTVTAPAVGSISVSPGSATVYVAATTPLTATVRDVNNLVIQGTTVLWSSDQPETASVSQSGVVTGLAPGAVTITASSGGKAGTAAITVQLAPVAKVIVTPSTLELRDRDGERTGILSATLQDALGNVLTGREVSWSSSKTQVATVNESGVVTAQNKGDTTVTATSEGVNGTATVKVRND
ncbi:MAG TPA: Ig-like domain-containing protein [Gemmatimonadaceae bacterium]